jgi:uncharacterized protein YjbI with pentapeptide repeats
MNNAKTCRSAGSTSKLLVIPLWLMLAACSSSESPSPAGDVQVNQHLVVQHSITAGATFKPHQTVALTLPAQKDDHLDVAGRYHLLPYEISNPGMYKFCIPEDDARLSQVELHDLSGHLLASWKKDEPCVSVSLTPGNYAMHVHLAASDWEPLVFMKPHAVSYTRSITGKRSGKSAASTFDGQIPMNQFKNLKVDSLAEILLVNRLNGADMEGWGLLTSGDEYGVNAPYHTLNQLPYYPRWNSTSYGSQWHSNVPATKLQLQDLIQFIDAGNKKYFIRQGLQPHSTNSEGFVGISSLSNNRSGILGLVPPQATYINAPFSLWLNSMDDNFSFHLDDESGNWHTALTWNSHDWVVGDSGTIVEFKVKVRYGTLSNPNFIPPMLANEVALLDQVYGPAGFPDGTHYWIINADATSFSDFAFNDPTNHVKTVIAGRGVRAQLFQYPNFQGSSAYVSPPADSEMIMTATDQTLLKEGTVGSVRIEASRNDTSAISFEYHTVLSSHSCIGCDLRGFDGKSLSSQATKGLDFSNSDLSYALFSQPNNYGGMISNSNFQNVTFNNAGLANDRFVATDFSKATFAGAQLSQVSFGSCNFTGTDFSQALMYGVQFSFDSKVATSGMAFYNACPKFENTDLTTVTGFDSYFPVGTGSFYNAITWWQKPCRVSLANSKISAELFKDKRLWQFVDAPGADFSNLNLDGAVFAGSNLARANFTNASLNGAVFTEANLAGADFAGADLTGAHFEGATLQNIDQNGAVIDQVALYKAKTLSKAILSGVTLKSPNLSNLDMSGAVLKGGSYTNWDGHIFLPRGGSSYSPASLDGAYMYNTKFNGAYLQGASLQGVSWFGEQATGENAIMEGTYFNVADMPGINLKKAHLKGADFSNCVLVNADLSTTASLDYSFVGTKFGNANLKGANLNGANLNGAYLDGAFIYSGQDRPATILEVMDDPTRNPGYYRFFSQSYGATVAPASTDGVITCPNGTRSAANDCGALTSIYWIRSGSPLEPTDCIKRPAQQGEIGDDQGNVLVCTSQRHRK